MPDAEATHLREILLTPTTAGWGARDPSLHVRRPLHGRPHRHCLRRVRAGADVFRKPTVAVGCFGVASLLPINACRSARWRTWTRVVGLALIILDLAGARCPEDLVPDLGPLSRDRSRRLRRPPGGRHLSQRGPAVRALPAPACPRPCRESAVSSPVIRRRARERALRSHRLPSPRAPAPNAG
jgi:hypothetical protein